MAEKMKYEDLHRRIGKFTVTRAALLGNYEEVLRVFEGMVIVRAETMWNNCVEYVALHPEFIPIKEGEIPVEYLIEFQRLEDGTIIRSFRSRDERFRWHTNSIRNV